MARVVNQLRGVQAELVLAANCELRELCGYEAAMDNLAKAIVHGRWRTLDFKSLAAWPRHIFGSKT